MAGRRFAFVLRLWMEGDPEDLDAPPSVRGSLQAVDAERTYYFSSFEGILELLRDFTGWPDKTNLE